MRKQYHLRKRGGRFDAWDVDRLIEAARGQEVEQVPLADISEVDSDYWFEASGRKASVRGVVEHMRLVREVDLGHPILLDPAGCLLDGMHRVAKALLEGQSHIDAIRLDALPPPDFERCDPTDLPYDR